MAFFRLLVVVLLAFSAHSKAEELQIPKGEVICDNAKHLCRYSPTVVTAPALLELVSGALFQTHRSALQPTAI